MRQIRGIMTFLQVLVSNILICLIEASYLHLTGLGIYNITPLYYKLTLRSEAMESNSAMFYGHCYITIRIEEDKQTIGFHSNVHIHRAMLRKLDARSAIIHGPSVQEPFVAHYTPQNYRYDTRLEVTSLDFNKTIENGYYVLDIEYYSYFSNILSKNGFVRAPCTDGYGNAKWMIATRIQNSGSHAIFPCWNNPRYKTVFDISIRHPNDYIALSNSIPSRSEPDDNDMTWTHYESTSPISPNCIAIVVMPDYYALYNHEDDDGYKVSLYSLLDYSKYQILKFGWDIIMATETYLKKKNIVDHCQMSKASYIAVRGFPYHQIIATHAFVLFREELIFVNETSSSETKFDVVNFLAQQVAYQWVLRSTNMFYWSLSWLYGASKILGLHLLQNINIPFELHPWSISVAYENHHFFQSSVNIYSILDEIFSSRSKFTSRCNNTKTFTKTDLFLISRLINESTCSSNVVPID